MRDGVKFGHTALSGGVKAFRLAAHLEEDLLLLQLPRELFLQRLQGAAQESQALEKKKNGQVPIHNCVVLHSLKLG